MKYSCFTAFLRSGEELEDKMIQLPSFLEALASIVRELSQVGLLCERSFYYRLHLDKKSSKIR